MTITTTEGRGTCRVDVVMIVMIMAVMVVIEASATIVEMTNRNNSERPRFFART